jgi:molybdate transport system permease protein
MDFSPVWISLKTTLAALLLTAAAGILAARWRVAARGRLVVVVDALLLLPLALPPTVVGLVLLLVFGRHSPLGDALSSVGVSILFSWPATVITAVVASFPIMYLSAQGAFQQVDADLLNAARAFGATEWTVLWKILLPLAWPGILAGGILSFVRALGEFGATLMLAGNLPGRTQTIPLAIFSAVDAGEMKEALLLSSVTLLISTAGLVFVRAPLSTSGWR